MTQNLCDKIRSARIGKSSTLSPEDAMLQAICEVVGSEISELRSRVKRAETKLAQFESAAKDFRVWSSVNKPLG